MNEAQSIALLYEKYKNDVFNLALHYLQDVQEAEEVMQDVFVKIYKNLAKFEQKAEIKTWAYRITINTCLEYLKAKKPKKHLANTSILYGFKPFARHWTIPTKRLPK